MYLKDETNFLFDKTSEKLDYKCFYSFHARQTFPHQINANIQNKACPTAKQLSKCSKTISLSWKPTDSDGVSSSAGFLKLISDKSQVSLSAGAMQFYPLHATLSKFSGKRRRKWISIGRAVMTYVPVKFEAKHPYQPHKSLRNAESRGFSKIDKLCPLGGTLESYLKPSLEFAVARFNVALEIGQEFLLHLPLS